ncbi:transposase [Rhodococcus triatomae]
MTNRSNRRSYTFEVKLEVVRRYLAGEAKLDLAREYDLASPKQVEVWVRRYRADGEDGLRPKQVGRPPKPAGAPDGDELERLRRENEVLRAQVAYLGKVRALRARERS